jgi:hypothetical protein
MCILKVEQHWKYVIGKGYTMYNLATMAEYFGKVVFAENKTIYWYN